MQPITPRLSAPGALYPHLLPESPTAPTPFIPVIPRPGQEMPPFPRTRR
jgi:hypothetical protein